MAARLKRQRREATIAFLAEPKALTSIVEFVADDGRTVYEFCKHNGLAYSQVHDWLYDKAYPERIAAYALALEARDKQLTERVHTLLREVAEADIRDFYDDKGNLLPIKKMPEALARAVQSVDISIDENLVMTKKLKLNDRLRGADMLGKALGMFRDRVEVSGAGGGPVRTEDVSMNEAARRVAFLLSAAVHGK